jgi:hypothetical protein
MCGGDEDRVTRVSSLANEEPLVVVEASVDIVREIVGKDGGDSHDGVIREREASLRVGGCGSVRQRSSGAKDGYVGCGWGVGSHRGSEVFATWGGDENVVRVDGDVLVEWSEEESVEDFLGDSRGSGRHR